MASSWEGGESCSLTLFMKRSIIKILSNFCTSTSFAPKSFYHRIDTFSSAFKIIYEIDEYTVVKRKPGYRLYLDQDFNLLSLANIIDAVTQTIFPSL